MLKIIFSKIYIFQCYIKYSNLLPKVKSFYLKYKKMAESLFDVSNFISLLMFYNLHPFVYIKIKISVNYLFILLT